MGDQRSTRRRYLAALGAVGTTGLAGCSDTLAGDLLQSGVDEATRERYIGDATATAAELDEWYRARSDTTRRLAQADVVQNGTPDEQTSWLKTEARQFSEDVLRVNLVERSSPSNVFASSDEAKVGEPLNTREAPWQGDSLEYGEDDVFASRAVEALTRSLVSFVTLIAPDGDPQELLVFQTDVDKLASTLQEPSEDGYTEIVDDEGRVVAGTRATEQLERNDGSLSSYLSGGDSQAVQAALDGESGFAEEPAINGSDEVDDDGPYVVAYAPVESRDWAVLVHVPKAAAKSG